MAVRAVADESGATGVGTGAMGDTAEGFAARIMSLRRVMSPEKSQYI